MLSCLRLVLLSMTRQWRFPRMSFSPGLVRKAGRSTRRRPPIPSTVLIGKSRSFFQNPGLHGCRGARGGLPDAFIMASRSIASLREPRAAPRPSAPTAPIGRIGRPGATSTGQSPLPGGTGSGWGRTSPTEPASSKSPPWAAGSPRLLGRGRDALWRAPAGLYLVICKREAAFSRWNVRLRQR